MPNIQTWAKRVFVTAGILAVTVLVIGSLWRNAPEPLQMQLKAIGTYRAPGPLFDEGVAEIVAHDPRTRRIFFINSHTNSVDVISFADPTDMQLLFSIPLSPYGSAPTSVAIQHGIVAVAVVAREKTDPGKAVFFDTDGKFLSAMTVGPQPDMIVFTPDRRFVLTANEGEPNDAYTVDPEGTVSIISISRGASQLSQADVRTAELAVFNNASIDPGIRIYGPGATAAQDLEPEYIAIADVHGLRG
jgi:DNA-binding beta-propeller fold protein YncE